MEHHGSKDEGRRQTEPPSKSLTLSGKECLPMPDPRHFAGHTDTPGLYVITVEGALDPDWSERLSGMQISPVPGTVVPRTRLTGWLRDQGSLHGVLSTLNSLALPIVTLERVRSDPEGGPT
jgi:hypothetical protein